ncbi:MAG: hypothetical protein B6241_13880 [Spirochaetaceae bacterium 4572_59]|nr:MAG: hypothetical protein B6241_13880 [Spirochaetaceae bacterium 4572_59]
MGEVTVHALRGINLAIQEGDFVAVAGPSGAGKTTIMNMIGLVDQPSSGSISIAGKSTAGLNDNQLTDHVVLLKDGKVEA